MDFIKCFECLRDLASQMHQSKEKPFILVNTFEKLFPIPENEIVTRVTLSAGDSPEIWDGSLSPYAIKIDIRSETQNQGCRDRGAAPASPADSAARTQHHDSVVASILSLGTVITRSDRDGTELHSSTALYYMCILPPGVMYSTQDNTTITAAPHLLH
ncbi:hypothetical protein TURU_155581 [Turdus rufiventris]|nr:hypothetical protein TURU_155581 [Turdus rufiventris]